MERDFFWPPAQVLLPEALNTSYIHSLCSLVFLHVHSSVGLLPYFLVLKEIIYSPFLISNCKAFAIILVPEYYSFYCASLNVLNFLLNKFGALKGRDL